MSLRRCEALNRTHHHKGIVVPARPTIAGKESRLTRFRTDLQKRYSERASRPPSPPEEAAAPEEYEEAPVQPRLRNLPPEVGILLTLVGTAGLVLPGVVGAPFLLAGGIALWPSGFRKVESWLQKAAPGMYETGVQQIEQFLADLERRYPDRAQ
jgi:hypothetical protein